MSDKQKWPLAHEIGRMGKDQYEAEGRDFADYKGVQNVERATAAPAPERAVAPPQAATPELSGLKVDELKGMAKERGVDGYSGMKKAELIKALS